MNNRVFDPSDIFSQTIGTPPTSQRLDENLKIKSNIPSKIPVKNIKQRNIAFDPKYTNPNCFDSRIDKSEYDLTTNKKLAGPTNIISSGLKKIVKQDAKANITTFNLFGYL
jgi:hypothetical protein